MSICLIVARYKEDISWLKNYKNFKIIIYNKGPEIKDREFKEIIKSLIYFELEKSTLHFHKFPNLSFSGQT